MLNFFFKILIIINAVLVFSSTYAQKRGGGGKGGKSSRDILASSGYTLVDLDARKYGGYNAFAKIFFPLRNRFQLGFGVKYDQATNSSNSSASLKNNYTFKTMQAGLDMGYKIPIRILQIHLNPFFYYAVSTQWDKVSTIANSNETESPKIKNNINYGIGTSFLFNIKRFYIGPSVYYNKGYLTYDAYYDQFGNYYRGASGEYEIINFNLTFGVYL